MTRRTTDQSSSRQTSRSPMKTWSVCGILMRSQFLMISESLSDLVLKQFSTKGIIFTEISKIQSNG